MVGPHKVFNLEFVADLSCDNDTVYGALQGTGTTILSVLTIEILKYSVLRY